MCVVLMIWTCWSLSLYRRNICSRILKKGFLGITYMAISLACLNFKPHYSVLSVAKGLMIFVLSHQLFISPIHVKFHNGTMADSKNYKWKRKPTNLSCYCLTKVRRVNETYYNAVDSMATNFLTITNNPVTSTRLEKVHDLKERVVWITKQQTTRSILTLSARFLINLFTEQVNCFN